METSILNNIRSRPRFKMHTPLTREAYEKQLRSYLQSHSQLFTNSVSKENTVISIKTKDDYYWKPYLTLRTETEEGKTVIRGIFGPSTAVWTFFMFIYMGFGVGAMTFLTLWYVTESIGNTDYPWAVWASIFCLAVMAGTYLASLWAKRKSAKEMKVLRSFAEESMRKMNFKDF